MGYTSGVETQPRTRLQVDVRRDQLLSLALELFRDRTYDEISIEEIAKAAGVSKGLLYHYFKGKRAFYVAAVRQAANDLIDETDPGDLVGAPNTKAMRQSMLSFLNYVGSSGKAYTFLMRGGMGNDPEVMAIIEETREAFLTRTIERLGTPPADEMARLLLRGWIGFVESISLDWAEKKHVPVEKLCDQMMKTSYAMITAAISSRPKA